MPNNLPEPIPRKEKFLASAAGMAVETPTPITREEIYLDAIAKGGGTVDAYTKAETDALLDGKVDKETGKGLSTNDFTDAYKTAVDGAAPQSTTYTKNEVDTILTPMTQAQYDALVTKTAPLYFIYEGGDNP